MEEGSRSRKTFEDFWSSEKGINSFNLGIESVAVGRDEWIKNYVRGRLYMT